MKSIHYRYIENIFRHIAKRAGCRFHSMSVETFHAMTESDGIENEQATLVVRFLGSGRVKAEQKRLRNLSFRIESLLYKKYDDYFCLEVIYMPNAAEEHYIYPYYS